MLRLSLFLAISAAILTLSLASLRHFRSHGFYRFFAFELLAALVVLNAPVWFREPLSARQLTSWFLGATSMALAIEGFRLLRVIGRPSATAGSNGELGFERTTVLVTVGAYRFIRHPLYASLLALAGCAWLKDPLSIAGVALALGSSAFLLATAVSEERENLARFGSVYEAYMNRTRRFLPLVF